MSKRSVTHTRRFAAAAAATVGLAALGAFALPLASVTTVIGVASAAPDATAPFPGTPASGESDGGPVGTPGGGIAPGVELLTELSDGVASCTANFVFTDGDAVYLGSAAHCHANGSSLNGCENESVPLGTEVTILGFDGQAYTASLAYSSWQAMQEVGETDEETCHLNDFALLEIDPRDVGQIDPSVPVFGGPEGLDEDGLEIAERVYSYQNDSDDPLPTMRAKQGVAIGTYDSGRGHVVYTTTPGLPGDSGSGYVDGNGNAFGVLSTVFEVSPGVLGNGVTDLALALEYAVDNADLGPVALVEGTTEFGTDGVEMSPLPPMPDTSLQPLLDDALELLTSLPIF